MRQSLALTLSSLFLMVRRKGMIRSACYQAGVLLLIFLLYFSIDLAVPCAGGGEARALSRLTRIRSRVETRWVKFSVEKTNLFARRSTVAWVAATVDAM